MHFGQYLICNAMISSKLTWQVLKRNAPDKRKAKKGLTGYKFNPSAIVPTYGAGRPAFAQVFVGAGHTPVESHIQWGRRGIPVEIALRFHWAGTDTHRI